MRYLVSKKQIEAQRKDASIFDDYKGPCQCCGSNRETFQNEDYAWICNRCHWTGGPRNLELNLQGGSI